MTKYVENKAWWPRFHLGFSNQKTYMKYHVNTLVSSAI